MVFYVGQKVVCVDDGPGPNVGKIIRGFIITDNLDGLTRETVYTVRGLGASPEDGTAAIYVEEIRRKISPLNGLEVPFSALRFRVVVERKTDISALTAILNNPHKKIPAPKKRELARN